jgi:hypothetical protein
MADKSTNVRPNEVSRFTTASPSNLLRTLPSGKAHGFYFTEPDQKEPPMKAKEALLEAYAVADEVRRLSMFLTYQDLRAAFTDIDAAQWRSAEKARVERAAAAPKPAFRRVAGRCRGLLRLCRWDL